MTTYPHIYIYIHFDILCHFCRYAENYHHRNFAQTSTRGLFNIDQVPCRLQPSFVLNLYLSSVLLQSWAQIADLYLYTLDGPTDIENSLYVLILWHVAYLFWYWQSTHIYLILYSYIYIYICRVHSHALVYLLMEERVNSPVLGPCADHLVTTIAECFHDIFFTVSFWQWHRV